MVTKDETRVAEARSSLDRIAAEGGALDSAMSSAGSKIGHDPGGSVPREDGIERWGRIIGRTLGWTAAIFLAWQFFRNFGA
jgi:hypothetical protein